MTDKQRNAAWDDFVKRIASGTLIRKSEDELEKRQRISQLEADPEAWFVYYFPAFAFADPAPFHKEATKRILENREWCEVRIWSRELAKSTRTMMEVFYLVLAGHPEAREGIATGGISKQKKKRCVLLISNSLDNASRLLLPYKANLEYNSRLINDYGQQEGDATWTTSEFITAGGLSFRAIGVGQSPRGTRNEEARPDVLIFDDVDTDADCLNPEIVARKWRWIEEAAIGTRSVSQDTTIIFCGNRIASDTCIGRASDIADETTVVNIRNEDERSSWPEKNSEADIDRVLSQKSYAAQQKEYFNNPITEGSVFKEMAYKPARPLDDYEMLICYTDPSYKTNADFKATVLVGRWSNEFHVIKCFLEQTTTACMIDWHYYIMDLVKGAKCACYYFMEQVFMQDVLVKEVSDAGLRTGRNIPIKGDTRGKPDKFMRIESLLEPLHRNGLLYLNEAERHNRHMMRLAEQFGAFAPGGRAHDDGPDAVEGAVWLLNDMPRRTGKTGLGIGARPENNKRY